MGVELGKEVRTVPVLLRPARPLHMLRCAPNFLVDTRNTRRLQAARPCAR